jgi:hypothetical protein
MVETRFSRGKERLLLSEQTIQKDRTMSRRLGRVLPEEMIAVPKIGEWSLNEGHDLDFQLATTPASPARGRQIHTAASGTRSSKSSRPQTAYTGPPDSIHAPRINLADMMATEGNTIFPPGQSQLI